MTVALSDLAALLRNEPVFSACPVGDLARLLGKVTVRSLLPGEVLHEQGSQAQESYVVLSGCFCLDGPDHQPIAVRSGLLGQEAVLTMQAYATTVTATESAMVVVIPKAALQHAVWSNQDLRDLIFASFTDRFMHPSRTSETGSLLQAALTKLHTSLHKEMPVNKLVGWFLTLAAPVLTVYGLGQLANPPNEQAGYVMAILSAAVMMWIFRTLPDFVPALFAVMTLLLLGLVPQGIALSGFSSDSIFLALGIFALSIVLTNSGFSYRVLLWLLRIGPANKAWYNLCLFLTGTILTPLVPSCNGRILIMTPFLSDLLNGFATATANTEKSRLGASVLYGISLMSSIFLSSKSINFVVFGFLPLQEQAYFNWFIWLYTASVCGGVLVVLYGLGAMIVFRNHDRPRISPETVRTQLHMLGPMKSAEWAGLLGLGLLLLSFLSITINRIGVPWVALSILFALLTLDFLGKKEIQHQVDWSFILFLAGLIGMINAMRYLQIDVWLTQQMGWLATLMRDDFYSFIAVLATSIFVVRIAMPINATVIIFSTLLIPTSINVGVNPWLVGFLVLLFSESFIWPYQSSYYMQFSNLMAKTIAVDDRRLLLFNLYVSLAKLAAVYASIPFWQYLGIL
ncbi:MAG: anion permease [Magnetococcales bacterium]|nr:anion permease [Magnetococcales bacterium]